MKDTETFAWNKISLTFLETYPKESGYYLIFSKYNTPKILIASFDATTATWFQGVSVTPINSNFIVDYWMKLPEFPKGWDTRAGGSGYLS